MGFIGPGTWFAEDILYSSTVEWVKLSSDCRAIETTELLQVTYIMDYYAWCTRYDRILTVFDIFGVN